MAVPPLDPGAIGFSGSPSVLVYVSRLGERTALTRGLRQRSMSQVNHAALEPPSRTGQSTVEPHRGRPSDERQTLGESPKPAGNSRANPTDDLQHAARREPQRTATAISVGESAYPVAITG